MTNFLADAFKAIVGIGAWVCLGLSLAIGGYFIAQDGAMMTGVAVLVLGPLFTIIGFGSMALVIQNNDLLRRIADRGPAADREPAVTATRKTAAYPGERVEPRMRA